MRTLCVVLPRGLSHELFCAPCLHLSSNFVLRSAEADLPEGIESGSAGLDYQIQSILMWWMTMFSAVLMQAHCVSTV